MPRVKNKMSIWVKNKWVNLRRNIQRWHHLHRRWWKTHGWKRTNWQTRLLTLRFIYKLWVEKGISTRKKKLFLFVCFFYLCNSVHPAHPFLNSITRLWLSSRFCFCSLSNHLVTRTSTASTFSHVLKHLLMFVLVFCLFIWAGFWKEGKIGPLVYSANKWGCAAFYHNNATLPFLVIRLEYYSTAYWEYFAFLKALLIVFFCCCFNFIWGC